MASEIKIPGVLAVGTGDHWGTTSGLKDAATGKMQSAINADVQKKYEKPAGGIPLADISEEARSTFSADSAASAAAASQAKTAAETAKTGAETAKTAAEKALSDFNEAAVEYTQEVDAVAAERTLRLQAEKALESRVDGRTLYNRKTEGNKCIIEGGTTWSQGSCYFYDVESGDAVSIVASTTNAYYAFLTSNDTTNAPSFAEGYSAAININANRSASVNAPTDAKYLVICHQQKNGTSYIERTPASIKFNGKDAESDIKSSLKDIEQGIEGLESNKVDKVSGKTLSSNDLTNDLKQKYDGYTGAITEINNKILGKSSENDVDVSLIKKVSGRIVASSTQKDNLPISASSSQNLYFYPISNGKKYKLHGKVASSSTGYWGYSKELIDSVQSTTTIEGKLVDTTNPTDNSKPFDIVVDSALDYNYIVLCSAFDDCYVKECVTTYEGGIDDVAKIDAAFGNDIDYIGMIDVADGLIKSYGKEQTEKNACPVTNDEESYFVKYKTIPKKTNAEVSPMNIVAMNHDDLPASDYIGIRKVYNKYGFKAHFCWIFQPFKDIAEKKSAIKNIRRLISDGHEVGLHAIMEASYWRVNTLFDVRPDGSSSFAPTSNELKTDVGNGKNVFGVDVSGKMSSAGYASLANAYNNINIADVTDDQMKEINQLYSHYGDTKLVSGLDLQDNVVSKTRLQWLEYYYNKLIDDTLGYSSTATGITSKFAEDYTGTYPTAQQILTGDVSGCGHFTKGLFKGCSSSCNYEVLDRCVDVATAFARHYFGLGKFVDSHRHGVYYFSNAYLGEDGLYYRNRELSVVDGGGGRYYHSRDCVWKSMRDMFAERGIKSIVQDGVRNRVCLEGQTGLYFGQSGKTNQDNITCPQSYGYVGFPNIFGTSSAGSEIGTYSDFESFMSGIDDWLKYCFENAGQSVNRGGIGNRNVYATIKDVVKIVISSIGTGAIPKLCFDTIKKNPNIIAAQDLILRFISQLGYKAVGFNEADEIANAYTRDYSGNVFPNPSFNQSLIRIFGGSSTSNLAYVPDGWRSDSTGCTIVTSTGEISGTSCRIMSIDATSYAKLLTSMFGLPSGKYKFSFWAKNEGSSCEINLYKYKNGSKILGYNDDQYLVSSKSSGASWEKFTINFDIEDYHKNMVTRGNHIQEICEGYEENVSRICVTLNVNAGGKLYFAMPCVERVSD